MTLKTVPVTGILYNPDGSVSVGTSVVATLTVMDTDGGVVVPSQVSATTDSAGSFTLNLWPNSRGVNGSQYRVRANVPGALPGVLLLNVLITVPDSDPATPVPIASITNRTGPSALSDAQAAMLAAQAALVQAQQTLTTALAVGADLPNLDAVAAALTNLNAIAADLTNLSALGADLANVNALAAIISSLNAIAGDLTNINTVAGDKASIDAVAGDKANIDAVAGALTAINTAASNIAAIQNAAANAQSAATSANQAITAAATAGVYPNAYASALPQGVTAITISNGGSGGTNGTGYAGGVSGGPAGFAWTYDIVGGVATNAKITNPGIESTSTVPTLSFPNGSLGGTPAATATVGSLIANQTGYWVQSSDGFQLDRYKNASGTATRDSSISSIPTPVGTLTLSSATALHARTEAGGRVVEAIDTDGRPYWLGVGAVFDRVATSDIITAYERASFGNTTYQNFLYDKAKSALKKRIKINKLLVASTADASTSFARFPFYIPITNTTGVLLFSQRNSVVNDGEDHERQVCRSVTINPSAGTITTGSTVVIDQPSTWAGGTGGCAAGGVGVLLSNGNIRIVYNRLETDGLFSDASYERALHSTLSTDGGATWSAPVKIMGSAQIYNVNTGGTGGVPGTVPARNGCLTGAANCIVQIPSGTYSGRIVCSIYDAAASYIGAMYSDDGGVTWTRGTMFLGTINAKRYDESAITYCSDGTLRMLMRCEDNNGTTLTDMGAGLCTSSDGGATWTYVGHITSAGFGNSAIALTNASLGYATGFEKLLAADTVDPGLTRRTMHSLRLSYDKGNTFVGEVNFFPSVQGVGYSCLQRLPNGDYILAYETFNGAGNINQEDCVGMIYFNEAELIASANII